MCAAVVAAIAGLLLFTPPFLMCKGGFARGISVDNFDNPWEMAHVKGWGTPDEHVHDTTEFEHFYFVNFRFWEKLEIHQVEYAGEAEEAEVKRILPFLYSAKQNQKSRHRNTFGVKRGQESWYFDYVANHG